ncbi:SpoIVB peptidase [Thalassobacillus pellis]|uniref:SpoIVB peptidase n=1 Tax=Thalassobacillus pellis TaxID=748008 RepID=UPI0023BAF692|nr:SpoIVB peptidase [Thalassobacillus pellis]MBM7552347.1 stage IV sporulation protein B [Thalassobacillus pellis]
MRNRQLWKNAIGSILLLSMILLPFLSPVQQYLSIPTEWTTFEEQGLSTVPAISDISASQSDAIHAVKSKENISEQQRDEVFYNFAGLPLKKINVDYLEDFKIMPGGQSIGVKLHTKGVLVVGHHQVRTGEAQVSPGEAAGIKVGDIILKVNGVELKEMADMAPIVKESGKENKDLQVTVKRGDKTFETKLSPTYDVKDEKYRIGLYIRDSAAGIGTMTFYDPKSKKYGALGHVISDMDTRKPIEIHEGTIVRSNVTSIQKGSEGVPGEKRAEFSATRDRIGDITKNSPFGIFGTLEQDISNGINKKPLPIALSHEVKEGPAKILTVVEGEEVQEFEVEVVSTVPQKHPATKGMIVKITDPELLKRTGGIVQGMSGSPIIQDGKLIGAVTHVFVNDPTSGYGVHIEWMLQEAGIDIYQKKAS